MGEVVLHILEYIVAIPLSAFLNPVLIVLSLILGCRIRSSKYIPAYSLGIGLLSVVFGAIRSISKIGEISIVVYFVTIISNSIVSALILYLVSLVAGAFRSWRK